MADKYKKIIAVVLSAAMACSLMLPGTAFASETGNTSATSAVAEETSGTGDASVYTEETVAEEEPEEEAEVQQGKEEETPQAEEQANTADAEETAETADTSEDTFTEETEGVEETGDSETLDPEGVPSENEIEEVEEAETEKRPEEEPFIPANILTYSNEDTEEAKSGRSPVYDVVMTGEYDFNEGTYACLEQITDKDTVAWLGDDLNDVLKDDKKEAEIILPFDICIIDGSGDEVKTGQDVTVRIHMDDVSRLDDTVLYHQVRSGEWESLGYTAQNASNDELPYVEFVTDAFSPFLFCEESKIKEETDEEGSKAEAAKETEFTETAEEAEAAMEEDAPAPAEKSEAMEEKAGQAGGDKDKEETAREEKEDKTGTTKAEDAVNPENYHREFSYEDDAVTIKASVNEAGVIPGHAQFYCRPINEKSDEFLKIRQKMADYYGVSDDTLEIFPYDIGFAIGAEEVEPAYGSVSLRFSFKKPIGVEKQENVEVVHIKSGDEVQVLSDNVVSAGAVDDFDVELPSFSPVIITKTNLSSSPLKSIQKTDEYGNIYFISKTPNIKEDGTATTYYGNSQNLTDTIDLTGALFTDVVIKYRTESTSYDWLYIQDGNGTILKKDADNKQIGDSSGKIGGGGSSSLTPSNTVTYRLNAGPEAQIL